MITCRSCQSLLPEGGAKFCPECGATLATEAQPQDPLIGQIFSSRYRVLSRIGAGGMGTVYKGVQLNVRQDVAVKVLNQAYVQDNKAAQRFYNEARICAKIRHPNVVTVHDVGHKEGVLYMVMEYLEGTELADHLEAVSRIEPLQACKLAIQLFSGLQAAHNAGIIHRDLKPQNVMLLRADTDRPFAKILDFGISRLAGEAASLTQPGMVVGTPDYMSPEQAQGLVLDQRSDIYSMGVILFEMLTGCCPFSAPNAIAILYRVVNEPVPTLREMCPKVKFTPSVESMVGRCLAKDPKDRFQECSEAIAELKEVVEELKSPQMVPLHKAGDRVVGFDPVAARIASRQRAQAGRQERDEPERVNQRELMLVGETCSLLDRAYRGMEADSSEASSFDSLIDSTSDQLNRYFQLSPLLSVNIGRDGFFHRRVKIYDRPSGAGEGLPHQLFRADLRRLEFSQGVDADELCRFFDAITRSKQGSQVDDVVTHLWAQGLRHIRYYTVDDFLFMGVPDAKEVASERDIRARRQAQPSGKPAHRSAELAFKLATLDTGQSPKERQTLQELIGSEERQDDVSRLIEVLCWLLQTSSDDGELDLVVSALGNLVRLLAASRAYSHLLVFLQQSAAVMEEHSDPNLLAELEELLICAADSQLVQDLVTLLYDSDGRQQQQLIDAYLTMAGPYAVEGVIEALAWLEPMNNRKFLCSVLAKMSMGNAHLLKPGFDHKLWFVVRNMCYTLGENRDPTGLQLLVEALSSEEPRVRLEAVRALGRMNPEHLVDIFTPLLRDEPDGIVRKAMLNTLGALGAQAAYLLASLLDASGFDDWVDEDKVCLFRALARGKTDEAASALHQYLLRTSKGYRKRRAPDQDPLQTALSALEQMKTKKAIESIVDLYTNGPRSIRSLCAAAIERLRSQMGGGQ